MNRLQIYYLIGNILSLENDSERRKSIIHSFESPTLSWPLFISTASNHLVLQTIYCRLQEQNLIEFIPSEILIHLKYIRDLNYNRNLEILEQVKSINRILGKEGISPLYLKGIGNLIDGLYSDVAERIMYDIDFMVQEDQFETAAEILLNDDYRANKIYLSVKRKEMKHYPRLAKIGTRAAVEIHRIPVDYVYSRTFGAEEVWQNKKWVEVSSHCFVMSDRHKIIHNFIHSQLHHNGNLYAKTFMRNIYDLYLLSKRENLEPIFVQMNNYHQQAVNYISIMNKTFNIDHSNLKIFKLTGIIYLFRYEINLRTYFLSRVTYFIIKIFKAYIRLPMISIADKELRASLIKRLFNKHWYKQHFKSYKRKRLITNHLHY